MFTGKTRFFILFAFLMIPFLALSPMVAQTADGSMMDGLDGWMVNPIFTVGETVNGYTQPGILDGLGTMYTMKTNFKSMSATLRIIYDGDADPMRTLRSPDNLDWADDGWIYAQEDEAEEDTLDGEPLFGDGTVNPNDAASCV